jgi:putative ABC transport system ATP-binding protein
VSAPLLAGAPVIALQGVHKVHATGELEVQALRGVDLEIERGEFVAVMGPSGSGKTTLLEILGCLSRPSRGRYRFDGRDVEELGSDALARLRGEQIGFIFQSFNLLPRLDLVENVGLPLAYRGVARRERQRRAQDALERVGLAHRARHRPAEISGGERQRVAIARALVNHPALVLADEPTGNLDSQTGDEILSLFRGIHAEGHTVVVVTHDPHVGSQARRCLSIRDGRVESDRATPGGDPRATPSGHGPAA